MVFIKLISIWLKIRRKIRRMINPDEWSKMHCNFGDDEAAADAFERSKSLS